MTEITNMIATIGFPCSISLIVMYYVYLQNKSHREESKEFTQAIQKNTLVLQKLCDVLETDIDLGKDGN